MTTFYHENGNVSSNRSGSRDSGILFTDYVDASRGGVTMRTGSFNSRMNHFGQCIGSSLKLGSMTTYFDKSGMPSDRVTPF